MLDPSFAATAAAALKRYSGCEGSREEVVLHVIGGQPHVEGNDDLWRGVLAAFSAEPLTVVVVGPDMRDRPALLIETNLWVTHVSGVYDGYGDEPDLVLAFHPGFWGYDSWRSTIRGQFKPLHGTHEPHFLLRTPLIVTSYTPEEAQLDAIALGAATLELGADEDAAEAASTALHWHWRPEVNPHVGARREVASAPPGHDYRENHCWFAVSPPGDATTSVFCTILAEAIDDSDIDLAEVIVDDSDIDLADLAGAVENSDIEDHFKDIGEILKIKWLKDRDTGKDLDEAIVEFHDHATALKAVDRKNESELQGRTFYCQMRKRKPKAIAGCEFAVAGCDFAVAGSRAPAPAPASGMLSLAHAVMAAQGPRPTYADFASNIPADNPFAQEQ